MRYVPSKQLRTLSCARYYIWCSSVSYIPVHYCPTRVAGGRRSRPSILVNEGFYREDTFLIWSYRIQLGFETFAVVGLATGNLESQKRTECTNKWQNQRETVPSDSRCSSSPSGMAVERPGCEDLLAPKLTEYTRLISDGGPSNRVRAAIPRVQTSWRTPTASNPSFCIVSCGD